MRGSAAVFPEPSFPTPVRACPELATRCAELWLKNDGLSHPIYGGNKVRKARALIAEAKRRSARRVLSFGAAGSHHLLTLALFARAAGIECAAIVIAQPHSRHAEETLRAAIGAGLQVYPASSHRQIPLVLARARRAGDYGIPPGGSNALATLSCADAVDELAQQVADGALPEPDWIVTPLGSGGTCAGLAAGVIRRGLSSRVLGVQVLFGFAPRAAARFLAQSVLKRSARAHSPRALDAQLQFDASKIGRGYGFSSEAGARAGRIALSLGLSLDQTYTEKAFASVLELLRGEARFAAPRTDRRLRVLYWHTLAATDLTALLRDAPRLATLPNSVASLLRR